jgi:Ser/Thr protein kinase RdoA (MazF antagonist)
MSEVAKTHGLDGTLVEPDWPALGIEEVHALLGQYSHFSEPIEILSVSPRPFSAASVVATSGGRVFVKRHHRSVRDREGLLEEHRLMAHLAANGAQVPRVLAAAYEVHATPKGIDLYEDAISWTPFRSTGHAHSAGGALATLHLAAHGFPAQARKPRPLVASFSIFAGDGPENAMKRYLDARPALAADATTRGNCEEALELLAPFHAELLPLLPALAPLWTHNDLHASNLFWSDGTEHAQVTAIIDFGLADRTNAVHDLAHAIERNIVEWLALVQDPTHPDDMAVHFDHLFALLDGYESKRPLSAGEAAALAPMTALCHAEFALSEADYFLGVLHSPGKASMASEGWLVGHARWFRSERGRELVEALRQWAELRRRKPQGLAHA